MRHRLRAALAIAALPLLAACPKSGQAAHADLQSHDPLSRADTDEASGHLDQAIDDCRQALAMSPRRLDAWRRLVQLYAKGARLPEITHELLAKSKADPNNDALHYALGLAEFAETRTAGDQALVQFQQAEKLRPSEAEYPFRLGVAYFELERYQDAVGPLQRATQLAPDVAKYHVPLGLALAKLGRKKAAMDAFKSLLHLQPTSKDVKLAQQALEQFEDPMRDIPQAESANVKRGLDWLHQADQPQQAIDTFEDVLDRYPDLAQVHTLVGLAYERLDNSGAAIEHLEKAIELKPDDADPYLYLGELYYAKQKPEKAAGYFRQALARNPLLDRAYGRLGHIALTRGDAATALANFKPLVVLDPDSADAHKALAQAYEASGKYEQAESELENLVARDPKNPEAQLNLGYLYAGLAKQAKTPGEHDERSKQALASFQKVLDLQPSNVAASRAIEQLRAQAPK